ncbi:MAG: 4Fe-4S cluster-binding domain-containing protein [Syntrophomonadaceae bacterium]|nr:4Fe-4S cluster-binding domain-containing protein [Syntrophomonadaceae bacterium]
MRVAVIEQNFGKYVLDIFSSHPDCGIEIACFVEYQSKQSGIEKSGIPVVTLDDLKPGAGISYDAVLIAVSHNRELARLLIKLHDKGIGNIHVIRLFTLDKKADFLAENGFSAAHVDSLSEEKPYLVHLETHVCDHCNLNCKACNNFSPFVKERSCASAEQYEKDLAQLSELFSGIGRLFLLGGEPLLEPELSCRFMEISRKYFPNAELRYLTNGLLIPKMKDEFWDCVRENNAIIHITAYPPTLKLLPQIESILNSYKIIYFLTDLVNNFTKRWTLYPFEDAENNNSRCGSAGCHYLRDGKLAKCPDAVLIENLDKVMNTNLRSKDDVDIYSADSGWQMINTLAKPIDLCSNCTHKRLEGITWELTEGSPSLNDWMVEHRYEYEARKQSEEIENLISKLENAEELYNEEHTQLNEAKGTITSINAKLTNMEHKLSDTEKKLAVKNRQLRELQGHYNNILNSVSFKVGRVITWLPRKFTYAMKAIVKLWIESGKSISSRINGLRGIHRHFINNILPGFNKYAEIIMNNGSDSQLYITGTGKGDLYILCTYYDEYLRINEKTENAILVVTGESGKKVAQLFGVTKLEKVTADETVSLFKLFVFGEGCSINITILHHHIISRHTGILMRLEGLHNMDFAACTREAVFSDIDITCTKKPCFDFNSSFVEELFSRNNFKPKKTVLLCPYANSVKSLPEGFWEILADTLLKKGFCVCTNSVNDDEKPISGTSAVDMPYEYSVPFLEKAGYLISLRSGFNDVTNSAKCSMVVLYPEKDFKRGLASTLRTRESFSIKKMYSRHDVIELDVSEDNIQDIINSILFEFTKK